jgi:hypothetical protein
MEALQSVESAGAAQEADDAREGMPLRADEPGRSVPLARARETFAPLMRDGFFLVPRLATHEATGMTRREAAHLLDRGRGRARRRSACGRTHRRCGASRHRTAAASLRTWAPTSLNAVLHAAITTAPRGRREPRGALAGVPVAIKDNIATLRCPPRCGSRSSRAG